jgi:hypothetical protein
MQVSFVNKWICYVQVHTVFVILGSFVLTLLFAALNVAATNIWQSVAVPLLEHKQRALHALNLEILTLEDQVKALKLKLENNVVADVSGNESDEDFVTSPGFQN